MILIKQRSKSRRLVNYKHYLYHFTHPSNLPSIKKHGLLSWERLDQCGIYYIPASNSLSQNLDLKKGLSDYVRLSLDQKHPMADAAIYYGRVDRLIYIKIHPAVINFSETLFSDENTTANFAIIDNDPFTALNSSSKQAEILVEGVVEPKYIF